MSGGLSNSVSARMSSASNSTATAISSINQDYSKPNYAVPYTISENHRNNQEERRPKNYDHGKQRISSNFKSK